MERLMSFDKQLRTSIDTYYKHLMAKVDKRPLYLLQPSHIKSLREDLVSWLIDTSNKLEFNVRIKHLGVYLMHIYLNHHTDVDKVKWEMVALCCLLLAAKVDESQYPMHKKMNEILGNKYKLRDLVRQEMDILKFFNFNVLHVTIVDFMEIYSIFAVHPTDRRYGQIKNFEAVTLYVNKYIAYFMDKVILDASCYRFRPDRVAAAIILTTRHFMQLAPSWPVVLQHVTGYTEQDLNMCSKFLRRRLNEDTIRTVTKCVIDPINSACCNAVCSPLNSPLKKPAILSFTEYPLDPMNYSPPCRNAASSQLNSPFKKPAILDFTEYLLDPINNSPPCRITASSPLNSLLKKPAILSFTKYPLDPINNSPPCRNAASSPLNSPLKKTAILSITEYPLDPINYSPPCRNAASSPLSSPANIEDSETSPSSAKKNND